MSKTIVGRYDSSLDEEIHRVTEWLEDIGVHSPSKVEVSKFVIEKGRRAKVSESFAKDFFAELRGLR